MQCFRRDVGAFAMGRQQCGAVCDPARLNELLRLRLLDSPPEASFDRLTRLAARTLGAQVSLVSLVDDHRQFFKSAYGLPEPWASQRETPLSFSFCQHVVARGEALVIEDARLDPLVADNPTLFGALAYLGVPLKTQTGHTLGSFCVIANSPMRWTAVDQETMTELAASVMSEIWLRQTQVELAETNASLMRQVALGKATLDDLRHSDARLQAAQRLARVGSFEFHCNGTLGAHWSDEALRILNISKTRAPASVAEFVDTYVHTDDQHRVKLVLSTAIAKQQPGEIEYRVSSADGKTRPLLTAVEPEVRADGSTAAICTAVDVTERYEAEAALSEYRNELWHVARVATVGEMVTVMAHEINQPLAAISHTANACARFNTNSCMERAQLVKHLNTISDQAKRASTILRQLRSFVRKRPPTLDRVDLEHVIDDVIGLLSPAIRDLRVQISRNRPGSLPRVSGDEIQLGQLVLNLMRNALDAIESIPQSDRLISISTHAPNPEQVELEIGDNGPGITPEARAKIFDPFFTTRAKGLGMGLPISKTIAETHGGSLILCEPKQGAHGAIFRITFPVDS